MALNTLTAGQSTLRASLAIKDPAAASADYFADYRDVPGIGSITLPDEAAPETDVVTLQGTTSATGFSTTGTITVPISTLLTSHGAHRLLGSKKRSGGIVLVRIRTPQQARGNITSAYTVATGALGTIVFATAKQAEATNLLRRGQVFKVANALYTIEQLNEGTGNAVGTVVSADVLPLFSAVVTTAADLALGMPQAEWLDISCTVQQFGDGDIQPAGVIAGNLVLKPDSALSLSAATFT